VSTPTSTPRGQARAALERARAAAPGLPGTAPASMSIDTVPLGDGRMRLVDRRTRQVLGTAASPDQAQRTRNFFR
jgi:hypothetical protein